jgi:hypothetical protein
MIAGGCLGDTAQDIQSASDGTRLLSDGAGIAAKIAGKGAAIEEVGGLLGSVGGTFLKKAPLIGAVFAVVSTAMAMYKVGRAGQNVTAAGPPRPDEDPKRRQELEEWKAEMARDRKVDKALVTGMVGLLPVPFADRALSAYMDSEEENLKRRLDSASHPKANRQTASVATTFNNIIPAKTLGVTVVHAGSTVDDGLPHVARGPVRDENPTAQLRKPPGLTRT